MTEGKKGRPVLISVDLEFTDANLQNGRVMQIGAAVIDTDERFTRTLPVKNTHQASRWVQENLKDLLHECWRIQHEGAHLYPLSGLVPADLLNRVSEFSHWVYEQRCFAIDEVDGRVEDYPAVLVGYCIGYDFAFLLQLLNHCGLEFPFHYEAIDISAVAMGKLDMPWGFTGRQLREHLGMEEDPNAHDALSDAIHQAEMYRRLMALEL